MERNSVSLYTRNEGLLGTRIKTTAATVTALSIAVLAFVFIIMGTVPVAGKNIGDTRQTLDVPETTLVSGETTIKIIHSQNEKMTAIVTGNGAMSDEARTVCSDVTYRSVITDAIIEDGVTHIGAYAFARCDSLTSVEIPNSVASIGNSAFRLCRNLKSVTIPNSVTSIGENAFEGSGLTSVSIPYGVTSIEKFAFYSCYYLTVVV